MKAGRSRSILCRGFTGGTARPPLPCIAPHREPHRYCYVRYEDLAAEPERDLHRVCEVVGVPFEPRMIAMSDYENTENSSFAGVAREREYNLAIRVSDDVDRRTLLRAWDVDAG